MKAVSPQQLNTELYMSSKQHVTDTERNKDNHRQQLAESQQSHAVHTISIHRPQLQLCASCQRMQLKVCLSPLWLMVIFMGLGKACIIGDRFSTMQFSSHRVMPAMRGTFEAKGLAPIKV